jgi:hypothetical protein
MWAGLAFSYYVPGTPPSFAIITAAALAYLFAATFRPRVIVHRRAAAFRTRPGEAHIPS